MRKQKEKKHQTPGPFKQSCASALPMWCRLTIAAASGRRQYAKIAWDGLAAMAVQRKTPLTVGDLAELKQKSELRDSQPIEVAIGKHSVALLALPDGG